MAITIAQVVERFKKDVGHALSGQNKDCHAGIGILAMYGFSTRPSRDGFFAVRRGKAEGCLERFSRGGSPSRQTGTSGEDPTLPYEALANRESARL